MKPANSILALAIAATARLASAHYTFSQLIINDAAVGTDWQYIREHTRIYVPTKGSEILEDDFRCNRGASSGASTSVYTIKAGDKVALKQAYGGAGMQHPGPTQVYMSRAPGGDVTAYDGSGEWFKVFEGLLCGAGDAAALRDAAWCMYGEDRIAFTVPDGLPKGQYLVRAEHIAIHGAHVGEAEFYYACAQVEIEADGVADVPAPTVRIPGVYGLDDAAINFSVWGSETTYPDIPGPEVVEGGETRGSTTGEGSFSKRAVQAGIYTGSLAAKEMAAVRV